MNWGWREFALWYAWGLGTMLALGLISVVATFVRDNVLS